MKVRLTCTLCFAISALGAMAYLERSNRLSAQSLIASPVNLPVDPNAPGFFKGPKEPSFKGNKDLPTIRFISREKAIGKVPAKAKLVSTAFQRWQDFQSKNLENAGVDDISLDRMVWEVTLQFPEGVEVGGDKYYDAIVTKAVDGETGEVIYFKVAAPPEKVIRGNRPLLPGANNGNNQ